MQRDLDRLGAGIRRSVLERSKAAHVGHIGSSLSVADLLAVLYGAAVDPRPDDPADRDRLVLSKGHAALALYAALAEVGVLDRAALDTYCVGETELGVHPELGIPGVDFATGSLGQGLSLGVGAALAARLQGSPRRTWVLCSDAELDEGSVWEAALFAGHHGLGALTLIVDLNGQQALGHTRDVLDLGDVAARLGALGWDARDVDGHDTEALAAAMTEAPSDRPRAVVAHTTFGHGVDFMESTIAWHYLPMDDEQYASALAQVGAGT